jgi:hypothetical protein
MNTIYKARDNIYTHYPPPRTNEYLFPKDKIPLLRPIDTKIIFAGAPNGANIQKTSIPDNHSFKESIIKFMGYTNETRKNQAEIDKIGQMNEMIKKEVNSTTGLKLDTLI